MAHNDLFSPLPSSGACGVADYKLCREVAFTINQKNKITVAQIMYFYYPCLLCTENGVQAKANVAKGTSEVPYPYSGSL